MSKKTKFNMKEKLQLIIIMLLAIAFVGMNMKIGAFAKDNSKNDSTLKYKIINDITDFKINKVEYTVKDDNICFQMSYSSKVDKTIFFSMVNKNKVQAAIVPQGYPITKNSNSYEFSIPALNLKGITDLNIYIADNLTKSMIIGIMKGEKCSGISIPLDSKILSKEKQVPEAQTKDITNNIKMATNIVNAKNGFEISYTGIMKRKGTSELIVKYKAKKNGVLVTRGEVEDRGFMYINNIISGDNNILHLGISKELIDSINGFSIMEMDSLNDTEKPYEAYMALKIPKTAEEKKGEYNYTSVIGKLLITKHPAAATFGRGKLSSLPIYNDKSSDPFSVDLRGVDISSLNIGSDRLNDLMHADFDSKTIFPAKLPNGFDQSAIMDIGKNPGLGLKELHKKGITGKGVGIAIIDQNLLVDHEEYKDQLRCYEEIHWPSDANESSMHGPAVASIAVGKSIGVAPEADLYYIAEMHGTNTNGQFNWDFKPLAKSIDRVLEINDSLPQDRKIRVISISVGWDPSQQGYKEVTEAVNRAEKQGVFVISTCLQQTKGLAFMGLGRNPMDDPDKAESYTEGLFWKEYLDNIANINKNGLLVPMDSRTTASPTGNEDYVHYADGGLSWSVPYIAGLYALACQVDPKITPEMFWEKAVESGDALIIDKNSKKYNVGKIVNPQKLIDMLSEH